MCGAPDQLREQAAGAVAEALQDRLRAPAADPRTPRGRPAARAARRPARSGARTSGSDPRRSARPPRACRSRSAPPSARRACSGASARVVGHVERREPEERRVGERARTQEAARLQMAEAVLVARLDQERAIEVVRLLGGLVARGLVVADAAR